MMKYFKGGFFGLLCFLIIVAANSAFAADQNIGVTVDNTLVVVPPTPIIVQSQDITTDTVDLVVEVGSAFASETLNFVVTKTNTVTGDTTSETYTQNTDASAQATVSVSGLDPGTEYEFAVRYARPLGVFSADSTIHSATTLIDAPVLNSVDAITTDSADLHVIIDPAFIGSVMDFIVEVNEDGNVYTVQMTRNITSINVTLPMNSLDPGTDYTFKVKYARENTLNFSGYSNEESITTDSDAGDLEKPVIDDIRNVTTTSMEIVVEVNGHDNENLDFELQVTNKATGDVFIVNYNETVDNNGTTVFGVGGLNPGTEYEFKVRYTLDGESEYSDYSDPKSDHTEYLDADESVVICYNDSTISILQTELQSYLDRGAVIGSCDGTVDDEDVKICYKDKTRTVSKDKLQSYLDRGAEIGSCDDVDTVSGGSTDIDEDLDLTQKDEIREVILPEEAKTTYEAVAVAGTLTGAATALAGSAIPLFAAMPGALGSTIFLHFLELFGVIGRRKEDRNWGIVFDDQTHIPIQAAKIVLLNKMGKEMATTYSDKDGRFGFLVNPGTYVINIFKKDHALITDIEHDDVYGNLYDGKEIVIKDDYVMLSNIAMKAENIDWQEYADKKARQYNSKWALVKKYLFSSIYFIGFGITIIITYFYPSVFNLVMLGIYIVLFVYQTFFNKKRFGVIKTRTGKPIAFATVNLYDKKTSKKQNFAVTDSIGRYYLLSENGKYRLKAKGQPVSGTRFEKVSDIHVTDGIVRKDIIV